MRFILLGLCVLFTVTACKDSQANADTPAAGDKPYKATTVDECIQEKECVWHAYKNIILEKDASNVRKWYIPIKIGVLGNNKEFAEKAVQEFSRKLPKDFPIFLGIAGEGVNFVIVVSDDFDRDLNHTYKDFFLSNFGDLIYKSFEYFKPLLSRSTKPNSFGQPFLSKNYHYIGYILFIRDAETVSLYGRLLNIIGFTSPPYYLDGITDYNDDMLNKLNFLLLEILYHPLHEDNLHDFAKHRKNFDRIYQSLDINYQE